MGWLENGYEDLEREEGGEIRWAWLVRKIER